MLWKDGEPRKTYEFHEGTVYSPNDLMWHGHFNTGKDPMRHFAVRGESPRYSHDRFRNPLWTMIPMDEEPPEIQKGYLEELRRKGVKAEISVVED
jgi:hypothetical protein